MAKRRVFLAELPVGALGNVLSRARELRSQASGGATETFRALAGGQPIYDVRDVSRPRDYTEALRRYDRALGLSDK
jgi:hypothetical protein